ncbi:phosphodiester glycosidase family protein [Candidatus Gottesmanbacteria bacterium]|nr:phosphodiester glycosidase family protein [Candidatus Gottesmanbacteria bacterium]
MKLPAKIPVPRLSFFKSHWYHLVTLGLGALLLLSLVFQQMVLDFTKEQLAQLQEQTKTYKKQIDELLGEDQRLINKNLEEEIANIQKTYGQAVITYEDLVKLREQTKDTEKLDIQFAESLSFLSKQNYASAAATLVSLKDGISQALTKLAAAVVIPQNVPASNAPPGSGYARQSVSVDGQSFLVDIIAGDLGSTRVIVDTASDHDCSNNCPALSLGEYVARNGAYAGVNGSYFCPEMYPTCSDKKNSFDTLLMNKNKVYFNSANNVYSTVPAVIFLGGSVRFVGQSLNWGRDTSPDSLIANRPLLVSGGNIAFNGEGEPKEGNAGNRGFVANRGNTVFIGVVHAASVAQSAKVLHALGMDNALNLDDGGSTALWSGGYKVGPGRNLPNAILFVRR